jgi:hypothetical protein
MRSSLAIVAAAAIGVIAGSVQARPETSERVLCSLGGGPPRFSIARTQNIVAESEVIVRGTVIGETDAPAGSPRPNMRFVAVAVDEILRGSGVPDTIRIMGLINPQDTVPTDYGEVPHLSYLRRYAGSCISATYAEGGQYLLLLQRTEERDVLDPYWIPLAPTNDQVRGSNDRWVQWVRNEIARNSSRL